MGMVLKDNGDDIAFGRAAALSVSGGACPVMADMIVAALSPEEALLS